MVTEQEKRLLSGGTPLPEEGGLNIDPESLAAIFADPSTLANFYLWALDTGANPDPTDSGSAIGFLQFLQQQQLEAEAAQGPGGAAGRTIFPEESALLQEQAASERFGRDRDRQQFLEDQRQSQFANSSTKLQLAQTAQELADARREAATDALLQSLPFQVAPGTQHAPGFGPGGAAEELFDLIGLPFTPPPLPTTELPLNELVNAPTSGDAGAIEALLGPLLAEAGVAAPALQ